MAKKSGETKIEEQTFIDMLVNKTIFTLFQRLSFQSNHFFPPMNNKNFWILLNIMLT